MVGVLISIRRQFEKPHLNSPLDDLGEVSGAKLARDVVAVIFNGPDGAIEQCGYFSVLHALQGKLQDLRFSPGQRHAQARVIKTVAFEYRFNLGHEILPAQGLLDKLLRPLLDKRSHKCHNRYIPHG